MVEKKNTIAISDIQNEIPVTVDSLAISVQNHCLVHSNYKELPPISDMGDDPYKYAVSMSITIPNVSKNIRCFSSCEFFVMF